MKYVIAILRRIISFLKLLIIKILHFKYFKFDKLEVISFSTRFKFTGNGKIILGKKTGTRKNIEFNVNHNAEIIVGDRCFFNNNCMIVSYERIEIGNGCSFGPNVLIYDHDHDFNALGGINSMKYKIDPVIIGNNVWIGANTVVLRGTKIGDNCVIGAGSVIKGEYPDNSIITCKRNVSIKKYKPN